MNIRPEDLLNKTEKEIREIILKVGLDPFSTFLTSYLSDESNLDKLKTDPELFQKIAVILDSVLSYYQISRRAEDFSKKTPVRSDLVNKFIALYPADNDNTYQYN